MAGALWIYLIDTSRQTDCLLSLTVTFTAAGVTVWEAMTVGVGPATAALAGLTLLLLATSAYSRRLWRRERELTGSRRPPEVELRLR